MSKSNIGTNLAIAGLRGVIAFIFLWHGIPKAFNPQAGIEKFVGFGLPGILGPVTGFVEVVAATCLLGGVFHKHATTVLTMIIVAALATVQIPGGMSAAMERDMLVLAGTLMLAAAGPGRFSIGAKATP